MTFTRFRLLNDKAARSPETDRAACFHGHASDYVVPFVPGEAEQELSVACLRLTEVSSAC